MSFINDTLQQLTPTKQIMHLHLDYSKSTYDTIAMKDNVLLRTMQTSEHIVATNNGNGVDYKIHKQFVKDFLFVTFSKRQQMKAQYKQLLLFEDDAGLQCLYEENQFLVNSFNNRLYTKKLEKMDEYCYVMPWKSDELGITYIYRLNEESNLQKQNDFRAQLWAGCKDYDFISLLSLDKSLQQQTIQNIMKATCTMPIDVSFAIDLTPSYKQKTGFVHAHLIELYFGEDFASNIFEAYVFNFQKQLLQSVSTAFLQNLIAKRDVVYITREKFIVDIVKIAKAMYDTSIEEYSQKLVVVGEVGCIPDVYLFKNQLQFLPNHWVENTFAFHAEFQQNICQLDVAEHFGYSLLQENEAFCSRVIDGAVTLIVQQQIGQRKNNQNLQFISYEKLVERIDEQVFEKSIQQQLKAFYNESSPFVIYMNGEIEKRESIVRLLETVQ